MPGLMHQEVTVKKGMQRQTLNSCSQHDFQHTPTLFSTHPNTTHPNTILNTPQYFSTHPNTIHHTLDSRHTPSQDKPVHTRIYIIPPPQKKKKKSHALHLATICHFKHRNTQRQLSYPTHDLSCLRCYRPNEDKIFNPPLPINSPAKTKTSVSLLFEMFGTSQGTWPTTKMQ